MTWRLPSTAEICHHLTNKYDPTTVVFWRKHPRLFPLSLLYGLSEWKRLYIFHFRWSLWMNRKNVKSVKIIFTKSVIQRWRKKNKGSNKLWFNFDKRPLAELRTNLGNSDKQKGNPDQWKHDFHRCLFNSPFFLPYCI